MTTAHSAGGGFERRDIDLGNWRTAPYSSWSFQNVSEMVPSAIIRGTGKAERLPGHLGAVAEVVWKDAAGEFLSVPGVLESTHTDAFVVLKKGRIVGEWYGPTCDMQKPHLIFSVSKSVTGLMAGILVARGALSMDDRIVDYVPEIAGSAYADASVRQLFDMQISMDFSEDYLDKTGGYDRYRRATAWNPEKPGEGPSDLLTFLASIGKGEADHGTLHAYRSPNTDLAGFVLERAAGQRFHDLVETLLWQPMGAHSDAAITVDRLGVARAAGGMSVTARDLARLGDLVRVGGRGIVPKRWIDDMRTAGDKAIWAKGDQANLFEGGSYRSYWYCPSENELAAIGIHGQWIWIDFSRDVVIAKQSCQPLPEDAVTDDLLIATFRNVAQAL